MNIITIPPITAAQRAALHHGLNLLIILSDTCIKELDASGNAQTEIASYWRRMRDSANEMLAIIKEQA